MDDNTKRIVEGLRRCSDNFSVRSCLECELLCSENGNPGCFKLFAQAADLIEKLSARAEAAERDLTELANRMTVPMVCSYCAHREEDALCADWDKCFKWRGPQGGETNESNDTEASGRG